MLVTAELTMQICHVMDQTITSLPGGRLVAHATGANKASLFGVPKIGKTEASGRGTSLEQTNF